MRTWRSTPSLSSADRPGEYDPSPSPGPTYTPIIRLRNPQTDILYVWNIVESWTVRVSLALGIITLFPGLVIILYDFILYIWRFISALTLRHGPGDDLVLERELAEAREEQTDISITSATETMNTRRRTVSKSGIELSEVTFLPTLGRDHVGDPKRAD
ncbi:hypothetical protein EDC01DRAFT_164816 [Geopyxis carbonaria]|nr:hypothetical protein EDC01DRAFT_164816 [Geopyxis carbonaria]